MKIKYIIILIFLFNNGYSQSKINLQLKTELDSILFKDQIYREYVDSETTEERKNEIAKLTKKSRETLDVNSWNLINNYDKENLPKVEKIIEKYGYPGKNLVGEPTNTAVFYVIQHSDKINKYYPIIEKAGKQKELDFTYVAMMLDRKLLSENKEQIYGTQIYGRQIKNKETGKEDFFMYVQPIKNAKSVNKRREKAGFKTTVEENAKRFGIIYREYTFKELSKIN